MAPPNAAPRALRILGWEGLLASAAALAAGDGPASRPAPASLPVPIRRVLLERGGVAVVNGGFGSALARDPRDERQLFLLTDRGPNVDGARPGEKVFPVPNYIPAIGKFRLEEGKLESLAWIDLKGRDGAPLTGLPHPVESGGSGERAVDLEGRPIPNDPAGIDPGGHDPAGIDPEGLASLADGTFWVCEEYGPDLIHFDAAGKTIERIGPRGAGRALPRVLARRRPNRGFEGLAATADGKHLLAVLQAPLDNPGTAARKTSRAVRIVDYEIASGKTQQYLYELEKPGHSVHDIAAAQGGRWLVIESDGKVPGDPESPSKLKKVFEIDLAGASDLSDPKDDEGGIRFGGKTLEEASAEELASAGVRAARKREVLDLLAAGYPHEKPEGLCLLEAGTLAIVNDDDFGIAPDGKGGFVEKRLFDAARSPDRSTLRIYRIAR